MYAGPWHQCGHNGQKLASELVQAGIGGGVVISNRDLSFTRATEYAAAYRAAGAEVLFDHQLYEPNFGHAHLGTYPTRDIRQSISALNAQNVNWDSVGETIANVEAAIGTTAVLAPAVIYEAADDRTFDVNQALFDAAKDVADKQGKPVYATVVISSSSVNANRLEDVLARATTLHPDGWYYTIETGDIRLPTNRDQVRSLIRGGLALAATEKPVLHAYAGPMCLLSRSMGAVGSGIAFPQNTWGFTRSRFEQGEGGGGQATAPRYFSTALWGVLSYPVEFLAIAASHDVSSVLTPTPYSQGIAPPFAMPWTAADEKRHLLTALASRITAHTALSPLGANQSTTAFIESAIALQEALLAGTNPAQFDDRPSTYLTGWLGALNDVREQQSLDYQWLSELQ